VNLAIETRGLTRDFGQLRAVDDVSLQVPEGTVYGFLGPNGAGKTTTIRMLLGLIKPTAGSVRLNGVELTDRSSAALSGVGAIVETPGLYPNLSGRENLELSALTHGGDRGEIQALAQLVDLSHAMDRRVGRYSLGMRQRLAIARALMGRPRLLILDEPTNGLDPAGMAQLRELIVDLPRRFETTVFISSHLLGEIEQTASACGLLHRGQLVFQGSLGSLQQQVSASIEIESADIGPLKQWVEQRGWPVVINGNRARIEQSLSADQRSQLIADLVGQGIAISEFRLVQPSLETLFFDLTREDSA
jgi:ABC-2 type transport system ATP-binding protein